MTKNFKFISLVLTFVFCFSAIAFGQETTGSIEGTITDPNGAVVPGASVRIESIGTTAGYNNTVTTNADGYYIVPRVLPGVYRVTASSGSFAVKSQQVTVVLGKSAPVNLSLGVAGTKAVVDVTTDTVVIDPGDTKIDTNITKQVIDALPKGTQFTSLLKTAPNVRPEPLAAGFQIDGASGAENVFVVDGQEVTNFRTGQLNTNNNVPFELLQEVQVKSTGFEAEYGGATGGVINVVTAGGNNQIHGNFGISFQPSRFQGNRRPVLNRFNNTSTGYEYLNLPKDGGTNFFPVGSLTGPIVKDKVWFAAVVAPQIFEITEPGVPFYVNPNGTPDVLGRLPASAVPGTRAVSTTQDFSFHRRIDEYFARLDAQPTSKLRMYGTFLYNPIADQGSLPGYAYGLSNFSTAGPINGQVINQNAFLNNQGGRQNSNSVNGQITYNPTNKLVFNVRAGRNFLNEKLGSYGIPNQTRYLCSASGNPSAYASGCSASFTNFPSNFQIPYDVSTRRTLDADVSVFGFNFLGRHNFKAGYQYNRIANTTSQGYPNTGVVVLYYGLSIDNLTGQTPTAGNIGSGYLQRFGTIGSASSASNALFAQDQWQIGKRLTLNVGARIEKEDVPSFNPNNPGIHFNWGDKFAPRLGLAYDVTGNNKHKIFASYGWFYDRFKYELPRGSFGGDFYRRDYFELTPSRGTAYTSYTLANILGNNPDLPGGNCNNADAGTPIGTGYSVCQFDFRIPSNSGQGLEVSGAVDPNIKAARQSEYTIGYEGQLMRYMLFSARYTHKQLDRAVEDVGFPTPSGSEAYVIGNPGLGLACEVATANGYPCTRAHRKYDAFEVRLDKRLANNYFFNASYTYSRLFGNYSGLASSDEAGRSSPNVNRFFDEPFMGYNANGVAEDGRLATDRPHVFKAYGGYDFNWFGNKINQTEISFFYTIESGTPLTTVYTFDNVTTAILYGRGDLGRTPTYSSTDLNIDHKYKFGRDARFTFQPYVNILNLFDQKSVLGVQTSIQASANVSYASLTTGGCTTCVDYPSAIKRVFNGGIQQYVLNYLNANPAARLLNTYKLPNNYQSPRDVRFGMRLLF